MLKKITSILIILGVFGALIHGWWETCAWLAPHMLSEKDLSYSPLLQAVAVTTLLALVITLGALATAGLWAVGSALYKKLMEIW